MVQPSQFSRDVSAMQATVVTMLRCLSEEPSADDNDRVLYARWFCKRAIAQELGAVTPPISTTPISTTLMSTTPVVAAERTAAIATSDATETGISWADQVQTYLRRKREQVAP